MNDGGAVFSVYQRYFNDVQVYAYHFGILPHLKQKFKFMADYAGGVAGAASPQRG
jgi:hypothetical protein